jgi:hypothetical protein
LTQDIVCERIDTSFFRVVSPLPVMEIEGRKEDIFEFSKDSKKFAVSLTSLLTITIHINGCAATQFIQRKNDLLEIGKETNGSILTVSLKGRLDTLTAPKLESELSCASLQKTNFQV